MIEMRYKALPAFDTWDGWYAGTKGWLQYREDQGEWKDVPYVPCTQEEVQQAKGIK